MTKAVTSRSAISSAVQNERQPREGALGLVGQKLDAMRAELADWDAISRSIRFA